jgi:hypothetical protein
VGAKPIGIAWNENDLRERERKETERESQLYRRREDGAVYNLETITALLIFFI